MVSTVAEDPEVGEDGDQQREDINALQGIVAIHDPGVNHGGERQEDKSDNNEQEGVVSPVEIGCKEIKESESDPRKRNREENNQTGHLKSPCKEGWKTDGCV